MAEFPVLEDKVVKEDSEEEFQVSVDREAKED